MESMFSTKNPLKIAENCGIFIPENHFDVPRISDEMKTLLAAIDKQITKEPINKIFCPRCNAHLDEYFIEYCTYCGQKTKKGEIK